MANVTLGKVAPTPKGEWNGALEYEKLDIVTNSTTHKVYMAIQNVPANTAITNNEYWEVLGIQSSDAEIDDTAGDGDTNKVWSANKSYDEVTDLKNSTNNIKSQIEYTEDVIGYGKNIAFGAKLIIGTRSTTGIYSNTPGSTALNSLVPVSPQVKYRVKISGASTQTLRYYFYSANDETTLVDQSTVAMVDGECLVQNANGNYMSFIVGNIEIPGYFVSITPYLETQPLYNKISESIEGYFQPVTFTENVGLLSGNVNGSVSINSSFTNYSYAIIDVVPGEVYRFSCAINGAANHLIRIINASNKIIQRSYNGVNSYSTRYEGTVTVPKNATKMYVNWYNSYSILIQKYGLLKAENIYSISNIDLFFKSGLVTGCSAFAPTVSTNASYKHCVIMCNPGDKFIISGTYSGANNIFLAELDVSGNIIVASEIVGTDDVISNYNSEYTVSANGYGIVLCGLYAYPLMVNKRIYRTNEELSQDINSAIKGAGTIGKTAVVFGTSIPAGKVTINRTEYTIPSYAAMLCGMTVFNEAIGSSCARRGWRAEATANDSYGWTHHAWQNVFLSMGKNLTECTDLINNYDSKWKDLIGGDFAPAGQDDTGLGKPNAMDDYWAGKIRASSYENILVPYLDGTKPMPDLFIFEHGHNDVDSYNSQYSEITGVASVNPNDIADLDRSLFGDVMAFYIRLIWQANPRAKILIVSNYENDSEKYQHVFTAQKAVAESNKVYFCNVADVIGWSDVKKITTTGYWTGTPGIWVNSGGTSQTITCLGAAFPDKIHPHTDQSGKAVIREAEVIANYIRSHISFD